jgi:hypothetical protein
MEKAMEDNYFVFIELAVSIVLYLYFSFCLFIIAKKTGNLDNAILAWLPIINIILLIQIAKKPIWWILLLLVPLVNIIIYVIIWMKIAEARGKPSWLGVLFIIPVIFVFMPAVLASD